MTQVIDADDIKTRLLDNPLTEYAQFMHELATKGSSAGKSYVQLNLRTLMGGFCRFHGTEAQNKAAARFKHLHETALLGGSKAVDPSIEAVDGGKNNPEAILEIGYDARRQFKAAQDFLGPFAYKCVEYVVIGENGPTAYARFRLRGQPNNGRHTSRFEVEMRRLMDQLAEHWGWAMRSGR